MTETLYYRRNLPHIHPQNGAFFITFRLADSIPTALLQQYKEERNRALKSINEQVKSVELKKKRYDLEKRCFAKFDEWLDRCTDGPHWLKDERIAKIVADKIHELDGQRYILLAYCIMSNHVHLLIAALEGSPVSSTNVQGATRNFPLTDALRLLKGSTARYCNALLNRQGAFWHSESYDHFVRDEAELGRIAEYILHNPVKAGLVAEWRSWKYSFMADALALNVEAVQRHECRGT